MDKRLKITLVIAAVACAVFLALSYIYSLKEDIAALEVQKQNLLQDLEKEKNTVRELRLKNAGLRGYLRAAHKKVRQLFVSGDRSGRLESQFYALKAQNQALLQENTSMRAKLNSIDELKKLIRQLKQRMRIEGNRGFLINDGKPTVVPSRVKIEVTPAQ